MNLSHWEVTSNLLQKTQTDLFHLFSQTYTSTYMLCSCPDQVFARVSSHVAPNLLSPNLHLHFLICLRITSVQTYTYTCQSCANLECKSLSHGAVLHISLMLIACFQLAPGNAAEALADCTAAIELYRLLVPLHCHVGHCIIAGRK